VGRSQVWLPSGLPSHTRCRPSPVTVSPSLSYPGRPSASHAKNSSEVSSIVGTSRRTRPTLSASRPAMIPAIAPEIAEPAEMAP
jgi:hypothetical protein